MSRMQKKSGAWPETENTGGVLNKTAAGIIHTADSDASFPRGDFVDYFGAPEHPKGKSPVHGEPMATRRPGFAGAFWGEKVGKKAGEQ